MEQLCVRVGCDDGDGEGCIDLFVGSLNQANHRKLFNVFGAVEKNIEEFRIWEVFLITDIAFKVRMLYQTTPSA